MTTHVFIVDDGTFPVHLEYLFAGTGAAEHDVDFNGVPTSRLPHATERNLVGMMADATRVRIGDQVIFYLQASGAREGMFFGTFEVAQPVAFLDRNDGDNYLRERLGKALTFRVSLSTQRAVYPVGVSEWEALDEIKQIHAPYQMLWSLIYRKLKGNRGNTMITSYEAERLVQLIRNKNRRNELVVQDKALTFDIDRCQVALTSAPRRRYTGRRVPLNILPRLCKKHALGQVFEVHLQAYISAVLGKGENRTLDSSVLDGRSTEWLGNEVSCGVGMQRIDTMTVVESGRQSTVMPIELKATAAGPGVTRQVQRYVDWVSQYFIPNFQADIAPVVLAQKPASPDAELYRAFAAFNQKNADLCLPIRYVEFEVLGQDLIFARINY